MTDLEIILAAALSFVTMLYVARGDQLGDTEDALAELARDNDELRAHNAALVAANRGLLMGNGDAAWSAFVRRNSETGSGVEA